MGRGLAVQKEEPFGIKDIHNGINGFIICRHAAAHVIVSAHCLRNLGDEVFHNIFDVGFIHADFNILLARILASGLLFHRDVQNNFVTKNIGKFGRFLRIWQIRQDGKSDVGVQLREAL